jgi:alpha-D-xyloside xylohydrolase
MKTSTRTKLSYLSMLISSVILMILVSCKESGKITIKIAKNSKFPLFRIANSNGPDVVFLPISSDTGSIGFQQGNEIFWLSGKPVQTATDKDQTTYTWDVNSGDKVELQVNNINTEVSFKLNLITKDNLKKAQKWFVNIKAYDDEYFTGLLERVVDGDQNKSWRKGIEAAMNLRNQRVDMLVKATVAAYTPFYLSSGNYGFCIQGTWPGVFDFCKSHPSVVQISSEDPQMEFKLYFASLPKQIIQQHTLETGPSIIAPRWAFGPWRWRDEHHNNKVYFDGSAVKAPYNSDIIEDVLMMQAYDIPCTAYWIDRPWGTGNFGYDDFKIDSVRLPKFEEMIPWLRSKNMETMLWICPWAYGKMADFAKEKGYSLVAKSMMRPGGGKPGMPGMPNSAGRRGNRPGDQPMRQEETVVMDFTNPEAAKWWGENGPAKLAKMGVKGFKLDRGDGERECDSLNLKTYSGISYRENFNDYPRQFVQATYDAVKPILGEDFVLFPRAQYTGSARYGAMWAGDTYSSAEGLRSVVIAMQRCAVMGFPLWTSDGCGYTGMVDREVAKRWIGFECFSPIMEVGPTNDKGFWGMLGEPSFDSELLAVWRFYSRLRMSLVDYTYDLAKVAHETGMPVARPLFLEYPEQKECWNDWKTYKLGDDLLVSVIWEKGVTSQKVYLPSGETWIDLWNNKEYKGGRYLEVDAQPYQTPVFLRKGSRLVLPDFNILYNESVALTSVKYLMSDLEAKEGWK